MQFGTYFAYWEQEWNADYNFYCKKIASLGFDILEIAAASLAEMSDCQLEELKHCAKESNVTLTACIGLPQKYDVSSCDTERRRNGISYLKKIICGMEKAGIHKLGGIIYSYWPYCYTEPFDKQQTRSISIQSMKEVADIAAEHQVQLMVEVTNRFEHFLLNTAEEAINYVNDIQKENVKILLDCFHMNIEEDSIGEAIRQTGSLLGHFHVGECNRKVPGKGHMPWNEIAAALSDIDYQGAVVMEPFVRPGGTVGKDIKVWRDLSGNADEATLDRDIQSSLRFLKKTMLTQREK